MLPSQALNHSCMRLMRFGLAPHDHIGAHETAHHAARQQHSFACSRCFNPASAHNTPLCMMPPSWNCLVRLLCKIASLTVKVTSNQINWPPITSLLPPHPKITTYINIHIWRHLRLIKIFSAAFATLSCQQQPDRGMFSWKPCLLLFFPITETRSNYSDMCSLLCMRWNYRCYITRELPTNARFVGSALLEKRPDNKLHTYIQDHNKINLSHKITQKWSIFNFSLFCSSFQ